MYHVFRTLASCWNKENRDVFEPKIEESEKASSHQESNTGHLACSQYDNQTTMSPHNPLYGLFTSLYFNLKTRQTRQAYRTDKQAGKESMLLTELSYIIYYEPT